MDRRLSLSLSLSLWASLALEPVSALAQVPPLPGLGLDVPVDVDGDGVATYGDKYVFNHWLEIGGSLTKAMSGAQVKGSAVIDLSGFFRSSDAVLSSGSTAGALVGGGGAVAQAQAGGCATLAQLRLPFADPADPNTCPPTSVFADCHNTSFKFTTGFDFDPDQGLWASRWAEGAGPTEEGVVRMCLSNSPPLGTDGAFPVCPVIGHEPLFPAVDIVVRGGPVATCTYPSHAMTTWPDSLGQTGGDSICRSRIDPSQALCGSPSAPCPAPFDMCAAIAACEEYRTTEPFAIDALRGTTSIQFIRGGQAVGVSPDDIVFSDESGANGAARIAVGPLAGYVPCKTGADNPSVTLAEPAGAVKIWGLALGNFNDPQRETRVYFIAEHANGSRHLGELHQSGTVVQDFAPLPSGNLARTIEFDRQYSGDLFITEDSEFTEDPVNPEQSRARIWRVKKSGGAGGIVVFGHSFNKPNGLAFHPAGVLLVSEETVDAASNPSGDVLAVGGWRNKFKRGDANGDGVVDLGDVTTILNWLFAGGPVPSCLDAADAGDDGVLNGSDGSRISNWLFLGGEEPADPGPFQAGRDPTADLIDCITSAGGAIP